MITCVIMVAAIGGKGLNSNLQNTRTGCGGFCSSCIMWKESIAEGKLLLQLHVLLRL